MFWKRDKLFCEISPLTYQISLSKEIFKRHVRNLKETTDFANDRSDKKLSNLIASNSSNLIKHGKNIDPQTQKNKAVNIALVCRKMNGMIIHPGEVFSFWKVTGKITKRKGYLDGRILVKNRLEEGLGGGLCNLANTLHLLVVHSPLDVVEFHRHSDALAPDEGNRVPLSSGTSVIYNTQDYRFKNNTDQDIQLFLWCENEKLKGELRSVKAFPNEYRIVEEDHHFHKEDGKYYRISKIYKEIVDRASKKVIAKELLLNNHSEVMFDYSEIPADLIR